ncbi:hypothetical protein GCM10010182_71240 [Actinomadura cremea]|nr:hypothetical protein GCM10010182_71240 [Actinomadura cremea]
MNILGQSEPPAGVWRDKLKRPASIPSNDGGEGAVRTDSAVSPFGSGRSRPPALRPTVPSDRPIAQIAADLDISPRGMTDLGRQGRADAGKHPEQLSQRIDLQCKGPVLLTELGTGGHHALGRPSIPTSPRNPSHR